MQAKPDQAADLTSDIRKKNTRDLFDHGDVYVSKHSSIETPLKPIQYQKPYVKTHPLQKHSLKHVHYQLLPFLSLHLKENTIE